MQTKERTKFQAHNVYGIPELDAEFQAIGAEPPFYIWGDLRKSDQVQGTYLFYCEDYNFTALWKKEMQLVNTGVKCASEVNFAMTQHNVKAEVLYNIYRKRWLARFWQNHRIRIWVDVYVNPIWWEENLLGVPQEWQAFATRVNRYQLLPLEVQYNRLCERAKTEVKFLVYGGGEAIGQECKKRNWFWQPGKLDLIQKEMDEQDGEKEYEKN